MKKHIVILAALGAIPLATQASITTDATITAIFGHGNPNGGWYETSDNGINIGARIKDRQNGAIVENGNNYSPAPSTQGWNLEFSFDVTGTQVYLSSFSYYLSIDGGTAVNLLSLFNDNAYGNDSTPNAGGTVGTFAGMAGNNTIMQNSERYLWLSGISDQTSPHTFDFSVKDGSGRILNSDTITVNGGYSAVPEPSTYAAAGLMLLPLGAALLKTIRRKQFAVEKSNS